MRKRIISLVTALAVVMTMVIASAVVTVNAAGAAYSVPVKVDHYYDDSDGTNTPVWKLDYSEQITYDAFGNVTSINNVARKWSYKGSKPAKVVTGGKAAGMVGTGTYKKGKLKKSVYKVFVKGKKKSLATETYKYKKGWISKISGKKGKKKYTVTYSNKFYGNGMPKSITSTAKVAGGKYKTVLSFNDKGLVTVSKSKYDKMTVAYTYDSAGRAIEKVVYSDGFPMYRSVYTYNGTMTTNKKAYVGIMNDEFATHAVKDGLPMISPYLAK